MCAWPFAADDCPNAVAPQKMHNTTREKRVFNVLSPNLQDDIFSNSNRSANSEPV